MTTRTDLERQSDARQPYEPPVIEEVLEFETAALASCDKTADSACDYQPTTKS